MSHGEKLSRYSEHAISALLTYPTVSAAAQSISVCPKTLCRWMQDPEFSEQFREARREVMRFTTAKLQMAASQAVDELVEVMKNKSTPAGSRVAAARTILEMATRATEQEDLEVRVAHLEEQNEEQRNESPQSDQKTGMDEACKERYERFKHLLSH